MKKRTALRLANLWLLIFGILLFAFADSATEAAALALTVCGKSVIPSLFPFMVLSDLIVRRHLLDPLLPLVPMRRFFGLPSASAPALLLGGLCGFPIGAKTVCELYRQGALSKKDAERTLGLSNNTGPAFPFLIAGARLWHSAHFGRYLYFAQLIAAILLGVLARKGGTGEGKPRRELPSEPTESPLTSLLHALTEASRAVIPLVGYIVFFSVLCAIFSALIPSAILSAFLCSMLEFTTGVGKAAALGGTVGRFLTGFAIGFSGISVFVQSYNFTSAVGLSLRGTLRRKSLQGLLTGCLCLLYPLFFRA